MKSLGIDVGGSGIKGSVVDLDKGKLIRDRIRYDTPKPSTPKAVAAKINRLCKDFQWEGVVGCGFPAAIRSGEVLTAANIDSSWINVDGQSLLSETTGLKVKLINDADAAGIAEMSLGAGKDRRGVVFVITVGTGIGTALFINGRLVPNTELGHVTIAGVDAETEASDAARKRDDLTWRGWARRFNRYLQYLDSLFWPDLFILGGGAAKKFKKCGDYLDTRCPIIPAAYRNNAGIIGAAMYAHQESI